MKHTEGVFILDKPFGVTTRQAYRHIARSAKINNSKVGHAGTIDSLATGLIIVLVGRKNTRLSSVLSASHKEYYFEVDHSIKTNSMDMMCSEVYKVHDPITLGEIFAAIRKMLGKSIQVPPHKSALSFNGTRMYKLPQFIAIEASLLKARFVNIYDLRLVSFGVFKSYFYIKCASGTYLRSIAESMRGSISMIRRISIDKYNLYTKVD